jgi:hypothetical protein
MTDSRVYKWRSDFWKKRQGYSLARRSPTAKRAMPQNLQAEASLQHLLRPVNQAR